jgi:KUP system potassium uptake protein
VLHEKNVFLTVVNEEVPYVSHDDRLTFEDLGDGFYRILARYGFMEVPDIPTVLSQCKTQGLELDPRQATYVFSHTELLPSEKPPMARWRERLFLYLARNAVRPTRFFRIPHGRVVEIGKEVEF